MPENDDTSSVRPGNPGADCRRCGGDTVQVGWEDAVVAVHCERCDLTVALTGDAMTVSEAREMEAEWADYEVREGAEWGPDPWG